MNHKYSPKKLNSTKLFIDRQHTNIETTVRHRMQTAPHLVDRIELEAVLEGHTGCVNCLEWSDNGRYLASGSDDFHVILWDPFQRKQIHNLTTPHTGNIFSVKFLPKSGNSVIATGAADKHIYVYDLNRNNEPIWNCNCHWSRVKRLATAPELPFIFWSAGEDGHILQFDIREQHKCRIDDKVLLINLANNLGFHGEAKCVAVNPRRPELIAVGANDTFARLYDRRMMSLQYVENSFRRLQKGETNGKIPKDCVTYFCPGHFNKNNRKYSSYESKAVTYLTFNADGTELLVNMGVEHIYLYDINNAQRPVFLDLPEFQKNNESSAENAKVKLPEVVEIYKRIVSIDEITWSIIPILQRGNEFLEIEKHTCAIENYSTAIQMAPNFPVLYLNRATAYMRRLWYGDEYAALRDCHIALKLDSSYIKAHFRLARALFDLGRIQDAHDCLKELITRFPNYYNNYGVLMLKKDIAMSSEVLRNESANTLGGVNLSDNEKYWRTKARDYKERFIGHCNTNTDIKEANFFGIEGNYVVAGSDDGNLFIWERPTNRIKSIYKGDMAIVNCVQPHPNICMLATSGIDHEIKIWSPLANVSEERSNRLEYVDGIVESNQHKMKTDPFDFNATGAFCRSS